MVGDKAIVDRAVWLCACVAYDDAPVWLIYDTSDGKLGWRRVPDGMEVADLVETTLITGDHVDPNEVLRWLQDKDADWVPGGGVNDPAVIQSMGLTIRELWSR